jgi:hypothetical protein
MLKKEAATYTRADMAKIFIHTSVHDIKLVTLLPKPDDSVSPENCHDLAWSPSSPESNLKYSEKCC